MEEAGHGRATRCDSQFVHAFSDLGYCEWFFMNHYYHKPFMSQTIMDQCCLAIITCQPLASLASIKLIGSPQDLLDDPVLELQPDKAGPRYARDAA